MKTITNPLRRFIKTTRTWEAVNPALNVTTDENTIVFYLSPDMLRALADNPSLAWVDEGDNKVARVVIMSDQPIK